jgi:hypothetical protein
MTLRKVIKTRAAFPADGLDPRISPIFSTWAGCIEAFWRFYFVVSLVLDRKDQSYCHSQGGGLLL